MLISFTNLKLKDGSNMPEQKENSICHQSIKLESWFYH